MHDNWIKKLVYFLVGQTISLFGSALVQYAIVWYITLESKSGIVMTLSIICSFLPQLLISTVGGAWADRYSRKLLIILSDSMIAIATLTLAICFYLGYREYWLLFSALAIRSLGAGVQMPAVNAIIPQLVPEDRLMKVNGINGSVQSFIYLLSPAIGGWLMAAYNMESVFFVDVITATIAIFILMAIHIPMHNKSESVNANSLFDDLKHGMAYIRNHEFIGELLVFYAIFLFLVVPAAFLTPLLIAREYGEEVWMLTVNEILFSGGAVLGGIIISVWEGFKNKIHTLVFTCVGFGILTAMLGLADNFVVYLAIVGVTGIIMPFFNATGMVLFQQGVDNAMQGRVFGIVSMVSCAAMPVGMMLFGPAADIINIEILLIITGILMLLLGIWIYFDKRFNK